MTDRDWISLTIFGEARGESTAGRLAVASVIKNRRASKRWGQTYEAVVTAPKQFSCWNVNDMNFIVLQKLRGVIDAGLLEMTDPILRECYWIADGVLGNSFVPQVGNAMHYFATWLPKPPSWAQTGKYVSTIGAHSFYKDVA